MWMKKRFQNGRLILLLLLLTFGSLISLISNTSKIYSIIIEDLKKNVFKEEAILSYIYSISIIGFCIIPSGIIFSRPNASRNVLLYGILVTLFGYISLYVTQKICVYYMMVNVISDLSNSIVFIFLYGISFALILQGGVTLNLGSLWINLLYWPIKYSGLITSIQFTIYSIGGLSLSEIYRLCFLETGSIRHFFLTCFFISLFIGFFSIYMIINIEKRIILNTQEAFKNECEDGNSNSVGNDHDKKLNDGDSESLLTKEESTQVEEKSNNIDEILMSNDKYYDEYSKSENINNQSVINKIIIYDKNKSIKNLIIKNDDDNNNINITSLSSTIYLEKPEKLLINQKNMGKCQHIKTSILNFIKLISNLETISLIFVYLFTISTGQFFGTFIQRFSIYYIPDITKEKSIRMIQILTVIELFVRVVSGYLSDLLANNRIMYKSTQTIILTLTMSLSLLLIYYLKSYWLVVIFGVGFSYAGMYSIAPSYIRSLFRPTEFALVNSFCYSMVIPGNLILSIVLANTPQKYTTSLQIIGYLSLIPLSIMIMYKIQYLYKKCIVRNNIEDEKIDNEENNNINSNSRNIFENIEYGIDKIAQDITILQKDINNFQKVMSEINMIDKIKNKDKSDKNNISFTISTYSSSSSMLPSSGDISKNTSMSNIKNLEK
ncbi:signal peptide containing with 6 transmembrane domains [Cryptosporidium sp. chipmunk genotype I]|uniref:signal peptide containing with 6 transmembrane domains n=1 Tax=Cryptosporidium sp. chipmunk genotype I TaxID=1280935 RepID=UPI00351A3D8F|nr:signal peptide containing with 6 transmembrane domains [Cryptosporidium sp. chipmunk genotype I]